MQESHSPPQKGTSRAKDASSAAQRGKASMIAERVEMMPQRYRAGYLKAMGGWSKVAGIKAFCLECVCWQVTEVRRCTGHACPLYPYRPYK